MRLLRQQQTAHLRVKQQPKQQNAPDYKALDYVKLGDYKGLEVTLASIDVTDEEVEQQVETNLNNNDKSEEIKEGTVENGDVANIDYEGKLNGKAFDGGTAEGYDLTIGSGSFIDGFEDGLIGKKIGDTVDLNLTFPGRLQFHRPGRQRSCIYR